MGINILVIHAHDKNRGDEAAVKSLADELLSQIPDANIVISNNGDTPYPNMPLNVHQISRFPVPYSMVARIEFILSFIFNGKIAFTKLGLGFMSTLRSCDIVIHAPGGPSIGDTYYSAELLYLLKLDMIRRMNIPYMFYSPSMGPFNDKKRANLRKRVIRGAKYVYVRDPISYKYVKEFVPDVDVKLAMDSALQHDIDQDRYEPIYEQYTGLKAFVKSHEKCIGITITDLKWHPIHGKTNISGKINDTFQKFIDLLIDRGYGIVFIPQLYGTSDDATYMSGFMRPEHTFVISATEDRYDSYFQQYVIGKMYAVVGMRYHSNIFSAKMCTPFVSVSYEQKMREFMESTELSDYCIDLKDLCYEKLTSKFEQLEVNYDEYADKLKALHEPMKKKAYMPTQTIIDFLESKYKHK